MTDGEGMVDVVGMAGRFPRAASVADFWWALCEGRSCIEVVQGEDGAGGPGAEGVLDGIDGFDAPLFGFSPAEAALTDPQHRLLLECAWEALEDAGIPPVASPRPIGVFVSAGLSSYLVRNLLADPEVLATYGGFNLLIHNDKDFAAAALSHRLRLTGPTMTVGTACSSSLVAVHLAVQALLAGECDAAIAGGVSVQVPQRQGAGAGGVYATDGVCRPYDARATGTVGGSGAAVVVLRRAEDARRDGDRTWGTIVGSAVNNDGGGKMSFAAPTSSGHEAVVREALAVAGVEPGEIGLVEGHGTGTPLGDPIEVEALSAAFGPDVPRGRCALGSVKANVGHLDAAAGVTSLIKAVLAVHHGVIPAHPHFATPNPPSLAETSPFSVNPTTIEWPRPGARRAGVSSLGAGGTNAHVVVEQPPSGPEPGGAGREPAIVAVSARTAAAAAAAADRLADALEAAPDLPIASVARTLARGRVVLDERRAVVAADAVEAAGRLRGRRADRTGPRHRDLVLAFAGHGGQVPGMGAPLAAALPAFREVVDRHAAVVARSGGPDVARALLDPAVPPEELFDPVTSQVALFTYEIALVAALRTLGARPAALIGHSLGEIAAATASGVFAEEDALALVVERGRLFAAAPAGAMTALACSADVAESLLEGGAVVSAVNSPVQSVVSGPADALAAVERRAEHEGVQYLRLPATRAYHSPPLADLVGGLRDRLHGVELEPPGIPYVSALTGGWASPELATDPDAWTRQVHQPVRFGEAAACLARRGPAVVIEVGPGAALGRFLAAVADGGDDLRLLGSPADHRAVLEAVATAWECGAEVDLRAAVPEGEVVSLPTYPFERTRHWFGPVRPDRPGPVAAAAPPAAPPAPTPVPPTPLDDLPAHREDPARWLYAPGWRRLARAAPAADPVGEVVLAFVDGGIGDALAADLRARGATVVRVRPGARFRATAPHEYEVVPDRTEDLAGVLDREADGRLPRWVVHAWSAASDGADDDAAAMARVGPAQTTGLLALLALLRAAGRRGAAGPSRLLMLTSGARRVVGEDLVRPERATALAAAKIIPREYPDVSCVAVDLTDGAAAAASPTTVDDVRRELLGCGDEVEIALRGRSRWTPAVTAVAAPTVPDRQVARPGATYLVVGGLGGLGLTVAEDLAARGATVHVIGRTPAPPRHLWASTAAGEGPPAALSRRLLAADGRIVPHAADVTDREQVAGVLATIGPVDGVVHAAGVRDQGGTIQRRSGDDTLRSIDAKVLGCLVLDDLLPEALDFFVVFSSIGALLYKLKFGEVGYVAGNDFLEAFAQARRDRVGDATAIAWTDWHETGMWSRATGELRDKYHAEPSVPGGTSFMDHDLLMGLSPYEGVQTFHRILGLDEGTVIVSTVDLPAFLDVHGRFTTDDHRSVLDAMALTRAPAHRPTAGGEPPVGDVEAALARLWQRILGLPAVGRDEDFFELGGDSLLGLRVLGLVEEELGVACTLNQLFEHPTVASLAADLGVEPLADAEEVVL